MNGVTVLSLILAMVILAIEWQAAKAECNMDAPIPCRAGQMQPWPIITEPMGGSTPGVANLIWKEAACRLVIA